MPPSSAGGHTAAHKAKQTGFFSRGATFVPLETVSLCFGVSGFDMVSLPPALWGVFIIVYLRRNS